jgi:hypothetical protein
MHFIPIHILPPVFQHGTTFPFFVISTTLHLERDSLLELYESGGIGQDWGVFVCFVFGSSRATCRESLDEMEKKNLSEHDIR